MTRLRIQDLPIEERPREKAARFGVKGLSSAELLALLIRTGPQGQGAIQTGLSLLNRFAGLVGVARATPNDLCKVAGIGPVKALELAAVFELGRRATQEEVAREPLNDAVQVYEFLRAEMLMEQVEILKLLLLDVRLRLVQAREISRGTINESLAHPREILRPALETCAYGFILAHNHPSGDPSPSEADRRLTRRIAEAADLLQIRFCDHIIIGTPSRKHTGYFSFREAGLL